jgi:GNAT superfamily N-acetyltransferase
VPKGAQDMTYTVRALDATTWDAYAELIEHNGGVFGGCWCVGFHPKAWQIDPDEPGDHRPAKEKLVRTGRTHAAVVFDDDGHALGWAQYGSPEELPQIKHRRAYDQEPPAAPDWRITCIFVGKGHRQQGVARAALGGALDLIGHAGGGRVEAISEVTAGRDAPGRFLFSGTVELFEQHGFERIRQVGKHAWIVSRVIVPA